MGDPPEHHRGVIQQVSPLTGNPPPGVAFASRDSSKAFVYRDDGGSASSSTIRRRAPARRLLSDVLATINLATSPNTPRREPSYDITMHMSTPDEGSIPSRATADRRSPSIDGGSPPPSPEADGGDGVMSGSERSPPLLRVR
jgi:hypothetical protein